MFQFLIRTATTARVIYDESVSIHLNKAAKLTMAARIITPRIDISRFRFRHHLAFSYRASLTWPNAFSRSRARSWRLRRLSDLLGWVFGFGGRGRKEATNHPSSHPLASTLVFARLKSLTERKYKSQGKKKNLHVPPADQFPSRFVHARRFE